MTVHRPRRLRRSSQPWPPASHCSPAPPLVAAASTAAPHQLASGRPGACTTKPTIVLVHGAFADSSGWNDVAGRLISDGYPVIAFSNPLRSPPSDAEYLRQFLSTIHGPDRAGRALLRRRGDHQRGHRQPERQVARLRRGLRAWPRARASRRPTRSAAGTPTSPTTSSSGPTPARRRRRRRLHRPRVVPPAVRPGPAEVDRRVMAATQRPGALACALDPSGPPAWKSSPAGTWSPAGPDHPARGGAGDGRSAPARRPSRSTARTSR